MKIQPFIAPRAEAARLTKATGLSADNAVARIIGGPKRIPDTDDTPICTLEKLHHPDSIAQLQPPAVRRPTYDLAAYLAGRAAQAYLARPRIKSLVEATGGTDYDHFEEWTDAAFAYRRGSAAVLAFRGTIVWNLLQWAQSNFLVVPVGKPRRHLGFQWAWKRLRPQVLGWLDKAKTEQREIILTGHSLGGAIALLAAFELADRYPVRAVVTFGAPRVGLPAFRDVFLSKPIFSPEPTATPILLGQVTRRIMHVDDFVSRVPPPPVFRHVGDGFRLEATGHLVTGESRTITERLLGGFDRAVGWVYRQIDAQRAAMFPGALGQNYAGLGLAYTKGLAAPLLASGQPRESNLERAAHDIGQGKLPFWLLSPTLAVWHVILWTLGTLIALVVLILGIFDFNAHRSGLYTEAFARRPRGASAAFAIWPNPHLADALRRIRESTEKN